MSNPTVLISGASIAGPAAASWLAANGWDVTVVERSSRLREDGQNVDVRGSGREVVRRMGLEEAVRAEHTTETGMAFVDSRGATIAEFPADRTDDLSPTADLEILRGRLARLLHDHSAASAEYVFGDRITGLDDDGHGVDVRFARGPARRFDAVVVAEGARSRTRRLVLPEATLHELRLVWAYFTIPRTADDDRRWRMHLGGRGRVVHLRPDAVGTTRAMLSMSTDTLGFDRLDRAGATALLRATFDDLGWETPRILGALDDTTPYIDQVAQVRTPSFHRGRVALLGDAAWCAGPFGTGTTSALTGAYVLAGELGRTPDDVRGAFGRYERLLRPMTDRAQQFVMFHPRTDRQRRLLQLGMQVLAGPLGGTLRRAGLVDDTLPVQHLALPDYPVRTLAPATG
ncbi:FAD-dependent monooxygenase [Pseudonocardia sp. ICBG1293]|uniref:FAD-dependent monooxygenase n=1 Tax=Pseudonocardia sp. ICBG1293 TaxID=2844382 RepID=UPI001CCBFF71|nr:FAD-dependent monooxygenase [Pseudonocardia sp. ICBG1293]